MTAVKQKPSVFKLNGKVAFNYDPGYPGVPEFGVYVLGQPDPEDEMLEEIIASLQTILESRGEDH